MPGQYDRNSRIGTFKVSTGIDTSGIKQPKVSTAVPPVLKNVGTPPESSIELEHAGPDMGAIAGMANTAAQFAGSLYQGPEGTGDTDDMVHSASKLASNFGTWGVVAAAAMEASNMLTKASDTQFNTMDSGAAKDLGIKNAGGLAFANKIGGFLGNISPGFGAFANKSDQLYTTADAEYIMDAFASVGSKINAAQKLGGKRFMFGGRKINSLINDQKDNAALLDAIGVENKKVSSSIPYNASIFASQAMNRLYGGNTDVALSKNGSKLITEEEARRILESRKTVVEEVQVESFKNGGVIGIDSSVIPEGALHAHKNHLEEKNPELDEVTEKGIPVIVTDENGEYTQVAEIEREELVLTKTLTEKIEALWKDGSPEAMIEAGKLLTCELMTNTDDLNGNSTDKDK